MGTNERTGFPKLWTMVGYASVVGAALLTARILYEETFLTWRKGPQMVGFAMAHGAVPFIAATGLLVVLIGLLWSIVTLPILIRYKFRVPLVDWTPLIFLSLLAVLLAIPYETWEEFSVRIAGPGSHGNNFLVQAAAQNKRRFVTLLLSKGYDINYEDQGGTTPLSGASVGGHEEMVGFLLSQGAEVNRKDRLVGETPLMAAAEMGQLGTAKMLLKNGAAPCATDKEGHTAEGLARQYHRDDIAQYLSARYHCQENVIATPCVDSATSACVHP
jgi:hypothetical protein